ncbi:c2H2-type domain-containing protein, partial [Nephila pilipes]
MVSCIVCGKGFNTNYNLKRHTLQVHEKKYSHQCPDCSKKFAQPSDLKRHKDSVHSAEKNCIKLQKEAGKRKRLDLTISSRKKKSQLSTSAENSAAVLENSTTVPENSTTVPENSDDDLEKFSLPPKESESAFQKAYKSFNLPNNDSSLGIKEFLLLRKEETVFIFRNELKTYKSLKVSKWIHCIYSKETDAGKMIKNVEFKTSNNEIFQETNLVSLYDIMSEKIVKESEDFEGKNSGWTLHEILRLEVRTNRYSPFRGSSSFIEVPKQIAETKAIINVINKKDSQCFMWSVLAALYPSANHPNKTSSYVTHLNKLNFDGISFPTPLNEVKKFSKMNGKGINIYSFEEDLKIFPLLISDIVCEKHIDLLYIKNNDLGHYCFIKSLSRLVSKQLSKHQHKTYICKRCLSAFQTEYKLLQHNEMCGNKSPARVVMPSETCKFLKFKNFQHSLKIPFVVYADFECVTMKTDTCCPDPNFSFTNMYEKHVPIGFCYFISYQGGHYKDPVVYRGTDAPKCFIEKLEKDAIEIEHIYKNPKPLLPLTESEKQLYDNAKNCYVCDQTFRENNIKVRDHNHVTQKFNGPCCNSCNLAMKTPKFLPVFFHNLSGFEKCKDSCLPPISKFYNELNEEAISVEDYNHACRVFNQFNLSNLGEYCDLYVKTDVLLLTDLFENFRKICIQTYKLDPCWYFTTPALSWDAMLLKTKVAIELFTDYDMLLFIENGVRGGISQCCNRYAIANNKYMSNFNPDDEIKYLMYLDANNLYGYAMSKYLPLKDFVWSDNNLTTQDILNLSDESDVGYILEVDLDYPPDLHDKHSDFPLAPENKPPPNCKEPRLLTTLEPKTKYVLHYSNLKLYLKLGLILKKIHRVLKFFQSPWLKNYIDYNTKLRTKAVNDFQKDFYKLMNNSIFGKTMENVRRRVDIRLCSTEEQARKLIAKSNFNRRTIFSENLMAVHLKKTNIKFFKPIHVGMTILDLSKVLMYSFHYEYMKHRYDSKIKLMYTDTDSFIYEIKTDDFYSDMKDDLNLYDTSDYDKNNVYNLPLVNKKVIGKMKDENKGNIMTEY